MYAREEEEENDEKEDPTFSALTSVGEDFRIFSNVNTSINNGFAFHPRSCIYYNFITVSQMNDALSSFFWQAVDFDSLIVLRNK